MKRIFLTIIAIFCILTVQAQVKEIWKGELAVGPQKLPLVLNLQRGDTPSVTLDSPAQNAFGIPATLIHLSDDSIAISIPVIGAEFRGSITPEEIRGIFSQSGYNFPLNLIRATENKPQTDSRPQTPKAPFPYTTQEISFINPQDGYTLHGTLTLPTGYKQGEKVKGVVLVTGSGIQNRDEELTGHKPFAVIADYLARHGVASLRYDDRGWDKKQPSGALTLQSNIADASAAVEWLRQRPEISSTGIIGHSEGGIIGYDLAAYGRNGKPDFVVSLAGPLIKGDSLIIVQNRALLSKMGISEITVDQYCSLLPTALELMGSSNLQSLENRIENLSPRMEASLIENLYSIAKTDNSWLKSFISYDPVPALKSIAVPTLILLGKKDLQVPFEVNKNSFNCVNNPDLRLLEIDDCNHLFQHCTTGLPSEYAVIEETISPAVLSAILDFIIQ